MTEKEKDKDESLEAWNELFSTHPGFAHRIKDLNLQKSESENGTHDCKDHDALTLD